MVWLPGTFWDFPVLAEHQAARVTAANVTAQTAPSVCLSPAAVLAQAGNRQEEEQFTGHSNKEGDFTAGQKEEGEQGGNRT